MIVRARAPLRLGLAGGGTDVSPYCDQFGGAILNATISMYAYATIEPLAEPKVQFVSTDLAQAWQGDAVPRLETLGELGLHRAVYNRIVHQFNEDRPLPVRMTTFVEAPAGSGLGSSSTLVVAMVKAYQELLSLPLGEYEIAALAYQIERVDMALSGGKQDQYAATFGGFNFMEFYGEDRVIVNPLRIKDWIVSELEASMLLYYTGVSREGAHIVDEQRANVLRKDPVAIGAMHELKREAVLTKEAILKGDFELYAETLRRSWHSKKQMARQISNQAIDAVYEVALAGGAKAAKISGAGGGGFMMLMVDPSRRMEISNLLQGCGGKVMGCHFTPNGSQAWRIG